MYINMINFAAHSSLSLQWSDSHQQSITHKYVYVYRKSDVHGQTDEDIFDQVPWQRVIVVLETIQSKKKINNYSQLLPTLFKILSE